MDQNLKYWLAASMLPRIGPQQFLEVWQKFPSIADVFSASTENFYALGVGQHFINAIQKVNWSQLTQMLSWVEKKNHHIIVFDCPNYPSCLKEMMQPPLVLYVIGNAKVLSTIQIAIVGARNPTPQGLRDAFDFAADLAEIGLTITSGMAYGIDGAAHRGALSVSGMTIAVAGTGLHHVYPSAHRSLQNDIIERGGAIVSEFPLQVPPLAKNFPRRNRIISGLSRGVLVVEAALKSGSLSTARHGLEQGREIFAIPGSIHNPLTRGCHHLIRCGAKLVEQPDDLLEELQSVFPQIKRARVSPSLNADNLPPETLHLLQQIDYEITPLDVILLRSGLTASGVSSILLTLELQGYIQSVIGGYSRVIRK